MKKIKINQIDIKYWKRMKAIVETLLTNIYD